MCKLQLRFGQMGFTAAQPVFGRYLSSHEFGAILVTLVVLATVVLCCMAIDQAARLIDVDPTRL